MKIFCLNSRGGLFVVLALALVAPGRAPGAEAAGGGGTAEVVGPAIQMLLQSTNEADRGNGFAALRGEAEKGSPLAEYNVGVCYDTGFGVARDQAKALEYYQKSAKHGLAAAQFDLGLSYLRPGQGIRPDPELGVQWLRKAADQGFALAENQLGVCYRQGTGRAQNDEEAFKWFERAASHNLPKGLCNLGLAYLEGRGVKKDASQGINYLRRAAEKGLSKAEYHLALVYFQGVEATRNDRDAFEWALRSARQGFAPANRLGDEIAELLPPEQVEAIQKKVGGTPPR